MTFRPFRDGDSTGTFRNHLDTVVREIKALENDYALKASMVELEEYYVSQAVLDPLTLDAESHYIDEQKGTQIDVSHDFRRASFGGERIVVKGTVISIAIPYTGDPNLWRLRPSTYSSGYPELELRDNTVIFPCSFPDDSPDPERLKTEIKRTIQSLADAVGYLGQDVSNHNVEVKRAVPNALQEKLSKAKVAVAAVEGLGIPLRTKAQPSTFVALARRRKPPITRRAAPRDQFKPEPILDQREFDHILRVLKSMSLVIERSPASFSTLDEEAIRTHFLLQLNGHYEGSATGETFNASGKTDILIRVDDRNIFIAECKFWRGPKSFSDAVSQLLEYLSWRDSKCALLVFNRTKDSSAVRHAMHEVMIARTEHRKTVAHDPDGDSRYVFVKTSDPGREIQIQTMVFDVPKPKP